MARPKVLLADNHPQFLEIVAGLLSVDYEVVAAVPDGRQALESSLLLDPDVAILDIRMPEFDGFETLRELRRMASRAKVVLLTLHQSDAYVLEAINSGAQGYVWKTRIHSDLKSAIDHALGGRLFVPSLTSLFSVAGNGHTVQFHSNDEFFLDELSQFVIATIRSGDPMVVVASDPIRTGIAQRLKERGLYLAAMAAQGQYVALDAVEALSQFMRDGRPDADCLAGIVENLERSRVSSPRGTQSRLTIFGEMAPLLLRDGNVEAAVEVERLWNRFTQSLPFFTVCGYPIDCLHDEGSKVFPNVCAEHCAVNHTLNA